MMKKTRRLIGLLVASFAVAMLMVVAATAAAADPLPPTDQGTLVIHKYVTDANMKGSSDGTQLSGDALPSTEPINGVNFDLYKVTGIPAAGMFYKLNGNQLEVYVNLSDTTPLATYPVSFVKQVTTATNPTYGGGVAEITDLDPSVYLAVEVPWDGTGTGPTGAVTGKPITISMVSDPIIVSLPMTDPTGTGWLTTVHVYPKNQTISITKTVDVPNDSAVAVGDTVNYTITSTIPDDIATARLYDVTDVLDSALTLDLNSVSVKVLPENVALNLTRGTDYTVSYDPDTDNTLVVSITATGRAKIAGYMQVQVSFSATVNANILDKVNYTVDNQAVVNFTNNNGDEYEADTDHEGPSVHTAAIQITKVDEHNQALNGSQFAIATSATNAAAGHYLRIDSSKKLIDYGATGYDQASDYLISPNNVASFQGLRDIIDGVYQSYWIVEVVAPHGYNLLGHPVQLTFSDAVTGHTLTTSVENSLGFVLPITGGTGTMLFTVSGIVLLGLAILIVIARKKKTKAID